jgi:hypothetical protein
MADLRGQYEEYVASRERELCLYRSGLRSTPQLARVDEDFADLTSGAVLDELARDLEGARLESARDDLRRLLHVVQDAVIASGARDLEMRLWERERQQSVRVGSREAGALEWMARLAEESEVSRRTEIQLGLDGAWAELQPLREELFGVCGELLTELGYSTLRAWAEARRPGVDYGMWREAATRLLSDTESAFRDALGRALEGVGIAPAAAHRGDALRVDRLPAYDALFPAPKLGDALNFTVEGMGIRMDELPGLSIDMVERPGKQASAFCSAPHPPEEVLLVAWPRPGVPACAGFLHQAGRALRYLFTSPSLPVERWRGADGALDQAWGALLSSRLADPEWIDVGPPAARAHAYAPDIQLRRCAELRRCAAAVRFELELAALEGGAHPGALDAVYATEFSEATGCEWGPRCGLRHGILRGYRLRMGTGGLPRRRRLRAFECRPAPRVVSRGSAVRVSTRAIRTPLLAKPRGG